MTLIYRGLEKHMQYVQICRRKKQSRGEREQQGSSRLFPREADSEMETIVKEAP